MHKTVQGGGENLHGVRGLNGQVVLSKVHPNVKSFFMFILEERLEKLQEKLGEIDKAVVRDANERNVTWEC